MKTQAFLMLSIMYHVHLIVWLHFTFHEYQSSLGAFNAFVTAATLIEGVNLPKRYLAAHLVHDSWFFGNPRVYANWQDEALNRLLRACCRNVSQATFEVTVLSAMQLLLVEQHQKVKKWLIIVWCGVPVNKSKAFRRMRCYTWYMIYMYIYIWIDIN